MNYSPSTRQVCKHEFVFQTSEMDVYGTEEVSQIFRVENTRCWNRASQNQSEKVKEGPKLNSVTLEWQSEKESKPNKQQTKWLKVLSSSPWGSIYRGG